MLEEQLIPDETDEQGQLIVQDLKHLFDTSHADQQSLSRIRERFLLRSSSALPVSEQPFQAAEPISQPGQLQTPLPLRSRKSAQLFWSRRLALVAALFIVALMVGSLLLILAQTRQQGRVGGPPFQSRPGWEQLSLYGGTGSKTISGFSLTLPQLYAINVTCSGGPKVDVTIEGPQYVGKYGLSPCVKELISQPASTNYAHSLKSITIQKITVTADAHTKWYLQIDQAKHQPDFTLPPFWYEIIAGGNGGDGPTGYEFNMRGDPNASAKTWGFVIMCLGTGQGKLTLTPDLGNVLVKNCSSQPTLQVVHYPAATRVTSVTVSMSKGSYYYIHVLSCLNEAKCASLPAAPITKSS